MFKVYKKEIEVAGKKISLETGKIARQADGAIIATCGETVVLATVVGASKVMKNGSSMLTLTYESTKAIPNYNVMGVCKSALEASVKYLARDLGTKGVRVNAISAGPIKTLAASAIGDAKFLYKWNEDHSFLKRNVDIHDVGNSALYLLSELANGVTGEIHYVDAGYNKVGMPDPKNIS